MKAHLAADCNQVGNPLAGSNVQAEVLKLTRNKLQLAHQAQARLNVCFSD